MKRILLTLAFLLSIFNLKAADITTITDAFKKGNASTLAAFMDAEVDMAIPGSSGKTNGKDAVARLNAFFNSSKPTGFTVLHHADKKENGFFVAKLPASSGEYRVNITYRTDGGKAIIQSIRIE
ncbi:MAG: DUF4783 domain-containing protein [Tannerellaceae bacterium]|jgi:hypothetical protein|nr:DUF4783 domain-containing protein [Tannerellaceae bacterium]